MRTILLEMYLKQNLGDDLFLQIITQRYNNVVFYSAVSSTYLTDYKLKNVHGRSLPRRMIEKCIGKLFGGKRWVGKRFNAEVILGGSMFIEQNLCKNELIDNMKQRYSNKIPLFILGANFGPYNNNFYFEEHKKLFARAKDVCFREQYSAGLFKDLKNVRVAPDIIFGLDTKQYLCEQKKKVIISVINLENRDNLRNYLEDYENKIVEIADKYSKCGYEVVLMSFCKYEGDEDVVNRIAARVSSDNIKPYYYNGNIDETLKQIASSEIVIGTRFHAVILGLVFGKRVLPIIYSDKTQNMLNDIAFKGKTVPIKDIASLDMSRIDEYLTSYGSIKKLRTESEGHFEKLDRFLGEGK